jgi:2-oxo-4-hydroxy-4-carboxy-5-ureidoimidazoline decarboxylase
VFLIRAAGRTAEEMLAALDERLRNDPQTERDVVRRELAQIVRLRLLRCVGTGAER